MCERIVCPMCRKFQHKSVCQLIIQFGFKNNKRHSILCDLQERSKAPNYFANQISVQAHKHPKLALCQKRSACLTTCYSLKILPSLNLQISPSKIQVFNVQILERSERQPMTKLANKCLKKTSKTNIMHQTYTAV